MRADSRGFFKRIGDYIDAGNTNAALRKEVAAARVQQVRSAALAEENSRLKALLGVVEATERPVATTRLVASTSSSTRRFAIIAAGYRQGVQVRMPVRGANGLVGRVLEVGPNTARGCWLPILKTSSPSAAPATASRPVQKGAPTGGCGCG